MYHAIGALLTKIKICVNDHVITRLPAWLASIKEVTHTLLACGWLWPIQWYHCLPIASHSAS